MKGKSLKKYTSNNILKTFKSDITLSELRDIQLFPILMKEGINLKAMELYNKKNNKKWKKSEKQIAKELGIYLLQLNEKLTNMSVNFAKGLGNFKAYVHCLHDHEIGINI